MPRIVRDTRLETREARRKLNPAGKPYWRLLDEGLHIGYRKGQSGGKSVVRRYVGAQKYVVETIGSADDGAMDADGEAIHTFSQAQAKARMLAAKIDPHLAPADLAGSYTVAKCLEEYLHWMGENRKSGVDARYRARAHILPNLGAKRCDQLSTQAIQGWLTDMANAPAENPDPQR